MAKMRVRMERTVSASSKPIPGANSSMFMF